MAVLAYAAGGSSDDRALYRYSTAAAATVQFAILLMFALLIARGDARRLFALRSPRSWSTAFRVGFLLLIAIFAWELVLGALPLPNPRREQGLLPPHWQPKYAAPFAVNAFPVVVLAPLVEELLFRGLGYSLLRRYGAVVAAFGTAVAWGLAHGLLVGLLVLIPLGLGLAWLRERTNSVVPGMIVHALFNAAALAAVVLVS